MPHSDVSSAPAPTITEGVSGGGVSPAAVLIRGARVIDGTGAPEYPADLWIRDGRIAAIAAAGELAVPAGAREVDATGLVVAPGFIDVHSHADNAPVLADDDLTKLAQGVTTEVTGNCGYSLAPVAPSREEAFLADSERLFSFPYSGWRSSAEWFAEIDRRGTVVNVCPLVGHGTLRIAAVGAEARAATPAELDEMGRLLREALEAGAFGFSSGLIYAPGCYSDTGELAHLARQLPADRVYATHMRDESGRLLESIDEALAVGRASGCRVQVSHLKAAGRQNWGGVARALERLDAARAAGVAVTQDVYPYAAASTSLGICLPPWAHDGGTEATLRRLADPEDRARMRAQILAGDDGTWENVLEGAGADGIMIADSRSHRFEGLTLVEIAAELGVDAVEALLTVLREEALDVRMVVFDMSEDDLVAALRSPFTAIGSDGLPPGRAGRQHPRLYGTFPRVLGRFVRELGVLSLPEAIRRMTSLPAEIFGVPERGTIEVGRIADLVCFDPAEIAHPGSYTVPELPPTGIRWVMQRGHLGLVDGVWSGHRHGERLRPASIPGGGAIASPTSATR